MSAQADSKAAQGYTTQVSNCRNCKHLTSEMALPRWMSIENAQRAVQGASPAYTIGRHGIETKFRCGVGGFAVKKTATCNKHVAKE